MNANDHPAALANGRSFAEDRAQGDLQNLDRDQRSSSLNQQLVERLGLFVQMVGTADVVIGNWRPAVKGHERASGRRSFKTPVLGRRHAAHASGRTWGEGPERLDVPACAVHTVREVVEDLPVRHPASFGRRSNIPPQDVGHTEAVLNDIGLSGEAIDDSEDFPLSDPQPFPMKSRGAPLMTVVSAEGMSGVSNADRTFGAAT